jgi:hypothetical protein
MIEIRSAENRLDSMAFDVSLAREELLEQFNRLLWFIAPMLNEKQSPVICSISCRQGHFAEHDSTRQELLSVAIAEKCQPKLRTDIRFVNGAKLLRYCFYRFGRGFETLHETQFFLKSNKSGRD